MDAARRDKRYASERALQIRCDSWRDFVELYATDISQGGMFVATDAPPPIFSTIDIKLSLPEATEILLKARVVHVLDAAQAGLDGKHPGVGVEFVELDAERQRQIYQLIEFARWQGATGDPNASLSRTLLELSQSSPPHKRATLDGKRATLPPEPKAQGARSTHRGDGGKRATLDGVPKGTHPDDVGFSLRPTKKSEPAMPRVAASPAAGAPPPTASAPPVPSSPPKPTDPVKLKLGMTHVAHKRFAQAMQIWKEMLEGNPGDPQVLKWQHVTVARQAIASGDDAAAAAAYEKALAHDETHHEAREFVRNYHRDRKLNAMPFGRYFTKKK